MRRQGKGKIINLGSIATVLLASDAGDYISGETIFVDGGWLPNAGPKG